jgi:hypothetical protein
MIKTIFTFLVFIMITSCQESKPEKDKERIDSVCDKFMQTFRDGKVSQALQLLKQNSVISPSTIDTLQVTISNQLNTIFPIYGNVILRIHF